MASPFVSADGTSFLERSDQPGAFRGSDGIFRGAAPKLRRRGKLQTSGVRDQIHSFPKSSYERIEHPRYGQTPMRDLSAVNDEEGRALDPPREMGMPFAATEPSSDPPWPNHRNPISDMPPASQCE